MASGADVVGGGSVLGTVVETGFAVADWFNRRRGFTATQQAQADAARAAGYDRTRAGWRDPDGRIVLERDVLRVGAGILAGPVIAPPTIPGTAPTPAPPQPQPTIGRRPPPRDSKRPRRQPIRPGAGMRDQPQPRAPGGYDPRATTRPPEPKFPTRPTINPNLPYYEPPRIWGPLLTRLFGVGALFWPTPTASDDTIPGRAPGSSRGPERRPRIRPRPPVGAQPAPVPNPTIVSAPAPQPVPRPQPTPLELPEITVTTGPISLPQPATVPAPTPTVSPWLAAPLLLPFVMPSPRLRDPLTQQPLTPGMPSSSSPPRIPPTLTPVITAGLPFNSAPIPSNDPCQQQRERERKKRKKRKPRAVCYRGTFTETQRSTLKRRKEQIPCR